MCESESQSLHLDEYRRYGRQMILDGFGLPGQLKLRQASVVVVGAGGLGCPALQYLAATGIGQIGIIDHDIVELSNLQRQILHSERTIGINKAVSAAQIIRGLNPRISVSVITDAIIPSNAVRLLTPYDVILDCTDNAPTRYLLSDTAVLLRKPLVSGAAQKFDGQLCIYNLGKDGPCYRCIFPKAPRHEVISTCEETGILGVVTGIIGNLQALEAIKIIIGKAEKPSLLLFSSIDTIPFRSVKMRSRRPACICSTGKKELDIENTDYVQFCGGRIPDWESRGLVEGIAESRISTMDFKDVLDTDANVLIIDVRPKVEFGICHLPGSVNIPLAEFVASPASHISSQEGLPKSTYIVCRLGNDSQIAAYALRETTSSSIIKDVIGGLRAWAKDVDHNFPIY